MSDTPRTDTIARNACDDLGFICRPELLWAGLKRFERELATAGQRRMEDAETIRQLRAEATEFKPDEELVNRIHTLERELAEALKWKEAVKECCVVDWSEFNEGDPLSTVQKLVAWNCDMALNPKISDDARKLRDTYKTERDQWREVAEGLRKFVTCADLNDEDLCRLDAVFDEFYRLKEASK